MWMRALSTSRAGERGLQLVDERLRPRRHAQLGGVDGGDAQAVGQHGAQLGPPAAATLTIAPFGSVSNSRPRMATSARPVLHRDHARQARGGVLAGAVADHRRRGDAPRLEQPAHRHLGGVQRGSATDGASRRTVASSRSPSGYSAAEQVDPAAAPQRSGTLSNAAPPHGWTSTPRCALYQACSAGARPSP